MVGIKSPNGILFVFARVVRPVCQSDGASRKQFNRNSRSASGHALLWRKCVLTSSYTCIKVAASYLNSTATGRTRFNEDVAFIKVFNLSQLLR